MAKTPPTDPVAPVQEDAKVEVPETSFEHTEARGDKPFEELTEQERLEQKRQAPPQKGQYADSHVVHTTPQTPGVEPGTADTVREQHKRV